MDSGAPYAVSGGNPLVSTAGALPEIRAYGLRNPFKASFDLSATTQLPRDI